MGRKVGGWGWAGNRVDLGGARQGGERSYYVVCNSQGINIFLKYSMSSAKLQNFKIINIRYVTSKILTRHFGKTKLAFLRRALETSPRASCRLRFTLCVLSALRIWGLKRG